MRRSHVLIGVGSAFAGALVMGAILPPRVPGSPSARVSIPAPFHPPAAGAPEPPAPTWSEAARLDALRHAVVWRAPAVPIERADLSGDHDSLPADLACRFLVGHVKGTSPKFQCVLPSGEKVKIKYGGAEPHGEVAGSRFLRALGFAADRVAFVRHVECAGCPWAPFVTMKAVDLARASGLFERVVNYGSSVGFDWVAVEQRFPAEPIETSSTEGWSWDEAGAIAGGPRAHVDALRLAAVFLAHWDNKAPNQRLVCLSAPIGGRCPQPLAMIQDLGATFGPRKVDLEGWRRVPIWSDRSRCVVDMRRLPYNGATFQPVTITEAGRQFLASRLTRLRQAQIEGLFRGARFDSHNGDIAGWTRAFQEKVQLIASGPPCPAA